MRLAGFKPTSIFDGFGVNFVVFFQGCLHHCPGCHNPHTWNFDAGFDMSFDDVIKKISTYRDFISGVTLSGGDPLFQKDSALKLAAWCKSQNLQTTLFTGFNLADIFPDCCDWNFDFIIDGKFVLEKKSINCLFRGSSNQHIWKKTSFGFESVGDDDSRSFVHSDL